ncbi:DUF4159 domain-containing protein [Gemmatimonadota bacterium]
MNRGALILIGSTMAVAGAGMAGPGIPAGPDLPPGSTASTALAQDPADPPYNGQYTFIRIRFDVSDMRGMGGFGGRNRGRGGGREPAWAHDYPRAETNFAKILDATTLIDTYQEGYSGRVLTLDDPELFKYPIASIIEVGSWRPSELEVTRLRDYLLKGGFLIVDDFRGSAVNNFQYQMQRVLPDHIIQYVPMDHEIFDSFFYIDDPSRLVPPYGRDIPQYLGIFEDNDLNGRIMAMINWNQDLQEYWEFSDAGYYPIDLSNEAYQFGVNYLIYAFTH